jgi:MFS transporter, CP family, cyanate transporter
VTSMDIASGLNRELIDAEAGDVPPVAPERFRSRLASLVLGASLVLVAFNLRTVFSSLSVLLPDIMRQTGLTAVAASYLTTLPVLCMGIFAPVAPILARRFGTERTLLGAVLLLAFGTALRGQGAPASLFAAAAIVGGSIAIGNVLLPGLVKRDFPKHTALLTGLYSMALCMGAAIAAASTVPIERLAGGSWRWGLAVWGAPALVAAVMWAPLARRKPATPRHASVSTQSLWRDGLAWQVTLFMGLQSAQAYTVFGWLAPALRARGMDGFHAGLVVSVSVVGQMIACLTVPSLATRRPTQIGISLLLVALATGAFLALLFAPLSMVWVWAVVLGLGQGGLLAVALTMIVLRAPDAQVAARLSGMAQGVGYTLAAGGPLLAGLLRGWTGGFASMGALFLAFGIAGALAGLGAGRALLVGHPRH